MSISLISFGFRYESPVADLTVDLRALLVDPAARSWVLPYTGLDARVREHVLGMPGVAEMVRRLACAIGALGELNPSVRVGIGCAGGRHRSVVVAEDLARRLHAQYQVTVEHRHLDRAA
jgi:RNase adapter protein RapZ